MSARLSRPWWLLPLGHLDARWWWPVGCALVVLDYALGPDPEFPVLYAAAVIGAAWYSGRTTAMTLAIVLPLVHGLLLALWRRPEHGAALMMTTAIRGAVVLLIGVGFGRLAHYE